MNNNATGFICPFFFLFCCSVVKFTQKHHGQDEMDIFWYPRQKGNLKGKENCYLNIPTGHITADRFGDYFGTPGIILHKHKRTTRLFPVTKITPQVAIFQI